MLIKKIIKTHQQQDFSVNDSFFDDKHIDRVVTILRWMNQYIHNDDQLKILIEAAKYHHHDTSEIENFFDTEQIKLAVISIVQASQELSKVRAYSFNVLYKDNDFGGNGGGKNLLYMYVKMIKSFSEDIQENLIFLRIALALDTLRYIDSITDNNLQKAIASEAIFVWAPIAEYYGLDAIKEELLEHAFPVLRPVAYHETIKKMTEKLGDKKTARYFLYDYIGVMTEVLESNGFSNITVCTDDDPPTMAEIKSCINKGHIVIIASLKSPYSTYCKMQTQVHSQYLLHDLIRLRIIVPGGEEDEQSCNQIIVILKKSGLYKPLSEISEKEYFDGSTTGHQVKANGYRAAHNTVIFKSSSNSYRPIEVQIISFGMHANNVQGTASHSNFKVNGEGSVSALSLLDMIADCSQAVKYVYVDGMGLVEIEEQANLFDLLLYYFYEQLRLNISEKAMLDSIVINGKEIQLNNITSVSISNGDYISIAPGDIKLKDILAIEPATVQSRIIKNMLLYDKDRIIKAIDQGRSAFFNIDFLSAYLSKAFQDKQIEAIINVLQLKIPGIDFFRQAYFGLKSWMLQSLDNDIGTLKRFGLADFDLFWLGIYFKVIDLKDSQRIFLDTIKPQIETLKKNEVTTKKYGHTLEIIIPKSVSSLKKVINILAVSAVNIEMGSKMIEKDGVYILELNLTHSPNMMLWGRGDHYLLQPLLEIQGLQILQKNNHMNRRKDTKNAWIDLIVEAKDIPGQLASILSWCEKIKDRPPIGFSVGQQGFITVQIPLTEQEKVCFSNGVLDSTPVIEKVSSALKVNPPDGIIIKELVLKSKD